MRCINFTVLRRGCQFQTRRIMTRTYPISRQLNKRLLTGGVEAEEGAAAAGAAGAAGGQMLKRVLGGIAAVVILYKTRLSNPIYEKMVGSEKVALESADVKADLPFFYKYDVKTAAQTMGPRLRSMETHLAKAMSNSTSPETAKRVEEIRTKGYSSGITVNLARGDKFAAAANVNELEKCFETIQDYKLNGGNLDEKEYTRVVTLGYHNKITALFTAAQNAANKGDANTCIGSVAEIETYLKSKVETLPSNMTNEDLASVQTKCHTKHVDNLLSQAQSIRKTGSRRETEARLRQARVYASAHSVGFDEENATSILQ